MRAGVARVITPVIHEQAGATGTRPRRELCACREKPDSLSIPILVDRSDFPFRSPFHDSTSRLLVRRDVFVASERQRIHSRGAHSSRVT